MSRQNGPTIKDVARLADVSIATVSRVINHNGYISSQTNKAVQDAIKQLGYRLPQHVRDQHQAGKRIEVILPSITNPLYAELYEYIEKRMTEENYKTFLYFDKGDKHTLDDYVMDIKHDTVAGVIVSSPLKTVGTINYSNLPIITFDRYIDKIPLVKCDNLEGGKKIAEKVLSLGKKKILILSGNRQDFYPLNNRIKGMLSVFNTYNVDVETNYINFVSAPIERRIQITQAITQPKYDAICCTDDITALLVKDWTVKLGYQPLVTGFDGSSFIQNFFPDLITVRQPTEEIAKLLCGLLIEKINHPSHHFDHEYLLPVTLLD